MGPAPLALVGLIRPLHRCLGLVPARRRPRLRAAKFQCRKPIVAVSNDAARTGPPCLSRRHRCDSVRYVRAGPGSSALPWQDRAFSTRVENLCAKKVSRSVRHQFAGQTPVTV
jgi:hypothetical protein